jgi:hypothetical protein
MGRGMFPTFDDATTLAQVVMSVEIMPPIEKACVETSMRLVFGSRVLAGDRADALPALNERAGVRHDETGLHDPVSPVVQLGGSAFEEARRPSDLAHIGRRGSVARDLPL